MKGWQVRRREGSGRGKENGVPCKQRIETDILPPSTSYFINENNGVITRPADKTPCNISQIYLLLNPFGKKVGR